MSAAQNYSRLASDAFAVALSKAGSVEEKFYRIGGCVVRLRFVGKTLQPIITPALEHLSIPATDPVDFTIDLADGTDVGIKLPFPAGKSLPGPDGAMWMHRDEKLSLVVQSETGTLSLVDFKDRRGLFWVRDAARLEWFEGGFPLRLLFGQWFRGRGQFLIHGAAVGTQVGAAIIVGKGGSGKSTSSLACADAGLFYLGDDHTLLGLEPESRVWSLYSSAKATPETLRRFPKLAKCVKHDNGMVEKSLLMLDKKNFSLAETLPIRAILWPQIVQRKETRLIPASPAKLLLALAPSTILQMPGAGAVELNAFRKLVETVPTFILEAGSDMKLIAEEIKKLLSP